MARRPPPLEIPCELVKRYRAHPATVGAYVVVAARFLRARRPVALSVALLRSIDPDVSTRTARAAIDRLLVGGWIVGARDDTPEVVIPTWGREGTACLEWKPGVQDFGRPGSLRSVTLQPDDLGPAAVLLTSDGMQPRIPGGVAGPRGSAVAVPAAAPEDIQGVVSLETLGQVCLRLVEGDRWEAQSFDDLLTRPAPTPLIMGTSKISPQYSLLGKIGDRRLEIDLDGTNTICVLGNQGSGKSYSTGIIAEALNPDPITQRTPIVRVSSSLGCVIMHHSDVESYAPEWVSMVAPNDHPDDVVRLEREYGATPRGIRDIVVLVPPDKLESRRAEFPDLQVEPLLFAARELSIRDWKFLLGVAGTSLYMKQVTLLLRQMRDNPQLNRLEAAIEESEELTDAQKLIVRTRLNFARQFIDDRRELGPVLRPGRLVIVDYRDPLADGDEILGLFVTILNIFANARTSHPFNRLIILDEAHNYFRKGSEIGQHIVKAIRLMRHMGVSLVIASQDPLQLDPSVVELSSIVILHRLSAPSWLKHLQKSLISLKRLKPEDLDALRPGMAYVWAREATEPVFARGPVLVQMRPRLSRHGGRTLQASERKGDGHHQQRLL